MASIKWIKLDVSIFDDEKIKIILTMPEGKAMLIVWLKLLCLAGKLNNSGVFLMNGTMPYTSEMLAAVFGETQQTMTLAIQTFKSLGMVEIHEDTLFLPNWEKHQSEEKMRVIREQSNARVAAYRERQRNMTTGNAQSNAECNVTETQQKRIGNAQETQQTKTKTKIENKTENKNAVEEAPATPAAEMPFGLTDDEIRASLERIMRIEHAAEDLGLPFKQADMVRAESIIAEYGEEWLLEAMARTGIRERRSWGMVIGILRSWKERGRIDDAFEKYDGNRSGRQPGPGPDGAARDFGEDGRTGAITTRNGLSAQRL